MTLIGRKILLKNTDDSGNPTLDFPITSIECVEGGASQEDLDTTNNTLTENTTNLQAQVDNLRNELTFMGSNMAYTLQVVDYVAGSYITLSNGLQIIMGTVHLSKNYGAFTFPKSFLFPPIVVTVGIGNKANLRYAPTETEFSVLSDTSDVTVHYIAIGMGAVLL